VLRSFLVLAILAPAASAAPLPDGFAVVAKSPDGKLGVLVPDVDHVKDGEQQNAVVELATGKVLATIDASTTFQSQSHAEIRARWSADRSTLVWYVDGKWESYAFVVLTFDHGTVHQFDIRRVAVPKALAAMRAARPAVFAEIKGRSDRAGSFYNDGFVVDVRPANGNASLPLPIVIEINGNPKDMDDVPSLAGTMTGVVGTDGKLTLSKLAVK
jgi:hypothetical protein